MCVCVCVCVWVTSSTYNVQLRSSRDTIFFDLFSLKMYKLRAGCVLLFASVLLSSLCTAQRTPSITYISGDQEALVGGTVELSCSVQFAAGQYLTHWSKSTGGRDSQFVYLSTDTSLVIKESRFALLYDGASSTYTVLIKDLQESDAGLYRCEIVLSVNNRVTGEANLFVKSPPTITDNSTQSIVTIAGEPVKMECYASGHPHPLVSWRRENNALLPTGEVHSICRVITTFGNSSFHLQIFR